ncbi:initiator tRNA phosphoribosyl transferase [Xylaria arbuscula]|nr:initiator tRNA phosphoribosyl transferase [Xylaria arbuscula]
MAAESDLIFSPQANHNFSRILTDLKRANLSISNRLRSIREDAAFVTEVARAYNDRPLIANERCGSWYIRPAEKAGSAYFKSTDGHAGQWNFSSRRLNLHLLAVIGRNDGCIVVDSTRRGKAMPDALSKTVPIWCCVLNRVLFPAADVKGRGEGEGEGGGEMEDHRLQLFTPPSVVSRSEHAQAEARIPEHVAALQALDIDVASLRKQIRKPLRPIWVTQDSQFIFSSSSSSTETETTIFEDFHPVICCTSSRRVRAGGEMSEGGYIQGAGDDTENWAPLGLTAPLFWDNADALLATPEPELPALVREIVVAAAAAAGQTVDEAGNVPVHQVAPRLFVSRVPVSVSVSVSAQTQMMMSGCCCVITFVPKTTDQNSWVKGHRMMEVGIGKQKIASRNLRVALGPICDFVEAYLKNLENGEAAGDDDSSRKEEQEEVAEASSFSSSASAQKRILVACETGKDLSIGVALALVCRFFEDDDEGRYKPWTPDSSGVNKSIIRMKLGRIMMAFPEANPSRTTLQSVNSYLMG